MTKTYIAIFYASYDSEKKKIYINVFNDNTAFRLLVIPVSSLSPTTNLYAHVWNDSSSLIS